MPSVRRALMAAAGNAGESLYVEDVFSTYLYDGNGSTQTITNGIDLDGEGGLTWFKARSSAVNNALVDTERGYTSADAKILYSDLTQGNSTNTNYLEATSTGFNLLSGSGGGSIMNGSGINYASWTFRKAEKFFDVVTYTGTGSAQNISHNLGSVPGCVIFKRTDSSADWLVWHRRINGTDADGSIKLNSSAAKQNGQPWDYDGVTDTYFPLISDWVEVNASGGSYVAYFFAHDAGGFGDDGSESIIKCGSAAATGLTTVDCGFEPQWVLIKSATVSNSWYIFDSMRGLHATGSGPQTLNPNLSGAEYTESTDTCNLTSTGFTFNSARFNGNATYIYIAIRRPMKTPESGTEVFDINTRSGNSTVGTVVDSDVTPDAVLIKSRSDNEHWMFSPRLLSSSSGTASNGLPLNETTGLSATWMYSFTNDSYTLYNSNEVNGSGKTYVDYIFSRASGFFDTVVYTGDGSSSLTVPHNLTVVPELILTSIYSTTGRRYVYHKDLGNTSGLWWNDNVSERTGESYWASTTPTASNFYVGASTTTNVSGGKYISFMFASIDGISKVGSYTGNGGSSTQQIDCGFSNGARFILIKDADGVNDWYVWDSARGIVAGNDPYLRLNQTAAENSDYDWVDPYSAGFEVTTDATAALRINVSGRNYIFLAIA